MNENKKLNKRQYAYEVIRKRILNGTYVPGQRIIIDQIAKEVGSSHIPVREAIHQLESDQLIEYKPNSGAVVRGINDKAYMEILEVLALIEGYATVLSAPYITRLGIEKLEALNNNMKVLLKNYELEQIGELNRDFHFTIYTFCPNQLLIQNITQMWDRMDAVRRTGFTFFPQRTPKSIDEHDTIINMLKQKTDMEELESFARMHKLNTLKAFKERN
ncbi:GntR family transcriptional regulator [Bacillus chungangensis]|uniref:DNA-binding GntR family transcriptional regulator n=1 Tax=Bacillus chungangensis TaxID=587633 RepID=A0ABT9WPZ3_9BACI|nr:GntR family transcriptional regulator [Bacillus chungangensis]MDQ0175359.1 DNA-binding GntR family transcriptional regulator [Bacillus chungangensis]